MGVYDKAIDTTLRLIQAKGQSIFIRVVEDGGPPDPSKPWKIGPSIETDYPAFGAFFDYTLKERENSRVAVGDIQCLVPAKNLPIVPTTKMVVLRGVKAYVIKHVEILQPAEDPILYTLQCREG